MRNTKMRVRFNLIRKNATFATCARSLDVTSRGSFETNRDDEAAFVVEMKSSMKCYSPRVSLSAEA